jgi:hypothetical protein
MGLHSLLKGWLHPEAIGIYIKPSKGSKISEKLDTVNILYHGNSTPN